MYTRIREKTAIASICFDPRPSEGKDGKHPDQDMLLRNIREGALFLRWSELEFREWADTPLALDQVMLFSQYALNIDTPRLGLNIMPSLTRRTLTQLMQALDSVTPPPVYATSGRALAYLCLSIVFLKMPGLRVQWRGEREVGVDAADAWLTAIYDADKAKKGDTEVTGYRLQEAAFFDFTLVQGAPPLWAERAALALSNIETVLGRSMREWQHDIWDNMTKETGGVVSYRTVLEQVSKVWSFFIDRLGALSSATASPGLALDLAMVINENDTPLSLANLREDCATSITEHVIEDSGSGIHVTVPLESVSLASVMPSRAEQKALAEYLQMRAAFLDQLGYTKIEAKAAASLVDIHVIDDGLGGRRGLVIRWKTSNTLPLAQEVFNVIPAGTGGEVRIQRLVDIPLSQEYLALSNNLEISHSAHSINVLRRAFQGSAPNYFIITDVPQALIRLLATAVCSYRYFHRVGYRFEINAGSVPKELYTNDQIRRFFGLTHDTAQPLPYTCLDYVTPLLAAMLLGRIKEQTSTPVRVPKQVMARREIIRPDPRRFWQIPRIVTVSIAHPGIGSVEPRVTYSDIPVLDGMHDQCVPAGDEADYYSEVSLEYLSHCHVSAWIHAQALRNAPNTAQLMDESCELVSRRTRCCAVLGLAWHLWRVSRDAQPYPLYWTDTARALAEYIVAAQYGFFQLVASGAPSALYYMLVSSISPIGAYAVAELERIISATGLTTSDMMRPALDRAITTLETEQV